MTALETAIAQVDRFIADICDLRPDVYAFRREQWAQGIEEMRSQIRGKQMIVFIGPYSSGKSSFINALIGEDILPTSSRPCTSVVTELTFVEGGGHRGFAVRKDNLQVATECDYKALLAMIDGPKGAVGDNAAYHHIALQYDITQTERESANLKLLCDSRAVIVDCPGFDSVYYCNEEIIEEYIGKASHTFWVNPVDRMGGASVVGRLSALRRKTTTIIPVLSKSDLIKSDEKKYDICNDYADSIGSLFNMKEPIFCSALKYRKSTELLRELEAGNHPKEAAEKIEKERSELLVESGVNNVLSAVIASTGESVVTDAKVSAVWVRLSDLIADVQAAAEREKRHWNNQLLQQGWDEKNNVKLDLARKNAELWIAGESDRVGRNLTLSLREEVQSYLDCNRGNIDQKVLLEKVTKIWRTCIDSNSEAWAKALAKEYSEKMSEVIDDDRQFNLPACLAAPNLSGQLRDAGEVLLAAVKESGFSTILQGGLGVSLLLSKSAVAGATLFWGKVAIGAGIAPVLGFAGVALLGVAAVTILPALLRAGKGKAGENRRELELSINKWLSNLQMREAVQKLLINENDKLYAKLEREDQVVSSALFDNKDRCEVAMRELSSVREMLNIQFKWELYR